MGADVSPAPSRGHACVFCAIVAGDVPAQIEERFGTALVIRPLYPVTEGHVLVIPKEHVRDAGERPTVTAAMFGVAAIYADEHWESYNLITSAGVPATQSVFHLHVHVVPRRPGDGLRLPWSP